MAEKERRRPKLKDLPGGQVTELIVIVVMALAIALNAKIKWRAGFRTIFFMPMVLSGLVVSYIFTFIIGTSVPIIAGAIHFAPLESSILANQHTAWLGIVFVASWVAIPGAIIIYLAGLVSIPKRCTRPPRSTGPAHGSSSSG